LIIPKSPSPTTTILAIGYVNANMFCTNFKCTNHTMETYRNKEEVVTNVVEVCYEVIDKDSTRQNVTKRMEKIQQGKMLPREWRKFNKAKCYQENGRNSTRQNEDD